MILRWSTWTLAGWCFGGQWKDLLEGSLLVMMRLECLTKSSPLDSAHKYPWCIKEWWIWWGACLALLLGKLLMFISWSCPSWPICVLSIWHCLFVETSQFVHCQFILLLVPYIVLTTSSTSPFTNNTINEFKTSAIFNTTRICLLYCFLQI